MIYGLLGIIAILIMYIVSMHHKLYAVKEIMHENAILTTEETENIKNNEYLKFSIDKDFNIIGMNKNMLKRCAYNEEAIIGKNVIGSVLEDISGNRELLKDMWKRLKKRKRVVSIEQAVQTSEGVKIPVTLRARPMLNELLQCYGISFWCYPMEQEMQLEKQLKTEQAKDKVVGEILNETSFYKYLEKRVDINNRYNRPLLLIVVDLADIHAFVNRGFSYETGDKLLRVGADACIETMGIRSCIGRFEGTKIGLIIEEYTEEKINETLQILWDNLISKIRKLNVDKVNAGMISIFYTQRKRNDKADNMLSRSRKYLKNSRINHRYGIETRDRLIKNK